MYKVIEGNGNVSFPFKGNNVILSSETSQEDLKKVYEHPYGPGFVEVVEDPAPAEVYVDPVTETVVVTPEAVESPTSDQEINPDQQVTEAPKPKKGGKA